MAGAVYALNRFNVTNGDEYLAYSRRSAKAVRAHGGRVVALGAASSQFDRCRRAGAACLIRYGGRIDMTDRRRVHRSAPAATAICGLSLTQCYRICAKATRSIYRVSRRR